jgi:hypothetical protein
VSGGPPSREILMEQLPVDFSDKDVGHHFFYSPNAMLAQSAIFVEHEG